MGSGSSSSIKTIHIDQKEELSGELPKKKNKFSPQRKEISEVEQSSPTSDTNKQIEDKDGTIETLTKQLCESESNRLDLEDRVETLLKELDYVNTQNVAREGEERPCEETVHAKDHYINKLEKEKTELETEVNKMRQRQRRKQKQFNTQMAEYKQEVNFQMMELKEEINRLKLENKQQTGNKVSQESSSKTFQIEDSPKLPGGEKMALILELSEQVTEQQDRITKLERKLKEKDQIVDELRSKLKNNSQYLSVLNKTKEDKEKHERNKTAGGNVGSNTGYAKNPSIKNDKNLFRNENGIDGLFTVEEESSENEEENLTKLSTLLQGVKSSNKEFINSDHSEGGENDVLGNGRIPETFEDLEANNGRDSGLGSAGKREEKGDIKSDSGKPGRIGMEWKDMTHSFESGSGLSDSDFEQYGPGLSKVSSAPPKLQNGNGARIKKKSNSLRRHASSKKNDRPPRPGVAFVNSVDTFHKDDHIINKLSPIISPVEVS
ncbi:uncharacterized protein PF3D7_1120000-like isoform X2 [Mercenaria mercenaria]|uniref:uncharacterized protein PF3D7_1120000-like isoform X2 n=1 Tax=Mercenaria mercenaria TaxID=6596 RepID=UPI00234E690A|nr:uncharacterized protein PF3D7_1120000-like isoform X2 [Mercenaria mercenaria]